MTEPNPSVLIDMLAWLEHKKNDEIMVEVIRTGVTQPGIPIDHEGR